MNTEAQQALNRMFVKLNQDIVNGSDEYRQLLVMAEPFIGKGAGHRCNNVMDILRALETRGELSITNFDTLLKMMDDALLRGYIETVTSTRTEIQRIINQGEDTPRPIQQTGTDVTDAAGIPVHPYGSGAVYEGKRGYVFIINYNFDRQGAKPDFEGLKRFFNDELSYEVVREEDLSKESLKDELKRTHRKLNDPSKKYDFFIFVVMSHGDEDGIILRNRNGEPEGKIQPDEIINMFKNDSMPNFVGRPRVFIIQACRGRDTQAGYEEDHPGEPERTSPIFLPTDADLMVAYSTTPGYKSYRNTVEGTVFIQGLLTVLQQGYKTKDLEKMLTTVRRNVAQNYGDKLKKQMPCTSTTLTKDLYLLPNV